MVEDRIFHITSRAEWRRSQAAGSYRAESLDTEGFIHCSLAEQVLWVANRFYRERAGLVLLCIDPARLLATLQYDEIETGDRFPHLYGALNLDAVAAVLDFVPDDEGLFTLPSEPHSEPAEQQ